MKNLLDKLVKLANSKPFKKGFTLTELLVVVLVIGVLAAIALPSYTKAVRKSRVSDALSNLNLVSMKQQDYLLNNEKYAENFKELNVPLTGLTSDGSAIKTGNFDYALKDACVYASSNRESYQLMRNVETQAVGCLSSGDEDFCSMVTDIVPTIDSAGSVSCEYVAPGGDGPSGITPPDDKDCGDCSKTCWDGSTVTGTCNTNTGMCQNIPACPPEPVGECSGSETMVKNNCNYTCVGNAWVYSSPAAGYDGYEESTGTCYKNACPDPTEQKNTIDGVHYCRTYTKGKWVPETWTKPC